MVGKLLFTILLFLLLSSTRSAQAAISLDTKPGDANGDNLVDGRDYIVWLTHYGQSVLGSSNGNFNGDSRVDGLDYVIWLNNYGPSPNTGQIPTTSPTPIAAAGNHNSNLWHSIQGQNHEHGDDPNSTAITAIFGSSGSYWNQGTGVNIGVPFNTSPLENTMKHPFSKYYTMLPSQIDAAWVPSTSTFNSGFTEDTDNSLSGNNRVRAWRMLVHGGGNLMEALANNHSAFVEIQICDFDQPSQCGIFRSGGWIFWGKFQSPFYNQVFQRSGGSFNVGGMTMQFPSDVADLTAIGSPYTVFDNWGGEPYWFMFPNDPSSWSRIANGEFVGDQISSNEVSPYNYDCAPFGSGCGNNLFHLAIRIFDGWNLADTTNINNPIFICSQISPSNCKYNGTYRGMKEVAVYVPVEWDQSSFDTDQRVGFVTLTRHTDRYQRLRPMGACSAISVDCVPLVLTNVPIGYASIKLKIQDIVPGIDREYDCPQGGCVSFPN